MNRLSCIVKPVMRGLGQGGVALIRHASARVGDSTLARHQGRHRFQKLHQAWPKNEITLEDIMNQVTNSKVSTDKQFSVLSGQVAENKTSADIQFSVLSGQMAENNALFSALSGQVAENKASADNHFSVLSGQMAENKASADEHFALNNERLDKVLATLNRLDNYNAKRDRELEQSSGHHISS